MHPCHLIYQYTDRPVYGHIEGTCRITGEAGKGLSFNKWVRPTFTDHAYLKPGDIISNEALFCFDEANVFLQHKTGRDLPQRFRNYTHIIASNTWYALTKADKKKIYQLITTNDCQLVVIAESGQRHLLFKHHPGWWQIEDHNMPADITLLTKLHGIMLRLMGLGFSQSQITTGNYKFYSTENILQWRLLEDGLKVHRRSAIFTLAAALMYTEQAVAV